MQSFGSRSNVKFGRITGSNWDIQTYSSQMHALACILVCFFPFSWGLYLNYKHTLDREKWVCVQAGKVKIKGEWVIGRYTVSSVTDFRMALGFWDWKKMASSFLITNTCSRREFWKSRKKIMYHLTTRENRC